MVNPSAVWLQHLVWSSRFEDELAPLVFVRVHEDPVSKPKWFTATLDSRVKVPFVSGLGFLYGLPGKGDHLLQLTKKGCPRLIRCLGRRLTVTAGEAFHGHWL